MNRSLTFTLALLMFAPLPAFAGGTQKRVVSSYAELDKGETEGAAIEASGRVTVGFLPQRGDVKATTAFSCLGQAKSVLVGSADEAAIWRVFPNLSARAGKASRPRGKAGKGAEGKKVAPEASLKVEKVAKLDGVVVSAMATLPGGDVLAAVVPGGKIVRVSGKGKVSTFAELKVSQIWALLVHGGRVYAGTGPKGELWSLSTAGKDPKVVLDVDEKDVLSVLAIGDAIVAGVGPKAKLYQVVGGVEGRMLHAFPGGDEARALTLTKTGLLVAVNAFADRKLSSLDALTKTLNRTSLTGQESSGGLTGDRTPAASAKLYHVDLGPKRDVARALEAPWEEWLERDKQYFTSLLTLDDGKTVLVASSDSGKIYRARGPRDVATVGDFEERQATALCSLPKGPVFATVAHGAGVYQLRAAAASGAKYRTEVFDAKQPASYGAIVLRGAGLSLRARVGPTEAHDRQWTEWKKIPLRKGIAGLRGSLGGLPHRRYLELEVSLDARDSELRSIELFYAPENLAPLLTAVDIDHPKFEDGSDKEPGSNMTIKWKVDARDDDDLVYDVRIRPEGSSDGEWIKLNGDDKLVTAKELKLDLTTMPDGVYEVEVRASDEPTNGSAHAKSDELRSAPFVVDRQRPEVTGISVKGRRITAKATDAGGYVHDVAYSIDGGPFRAASPSDGLFDSPGEDLAIELPELGKGKHRVVIRARDSFGNIGTAAVVITL
jgi:hypothetical protein